MAHDPRGRSGRFRHLSSEMVLRRPSGEVLAVDRFAIDGDALDERGAMAGFAVHAGFGVAGPAAGGPERLRAALAPVHGIYAGVSTLPHGAGLFARVLAEDGIALARASEALAAALPA
jgi:urease accessory protein